MTTLAPVLQAFFTERLMAQRRASSHTITGYRDTLRLLAGFACAKTGKTPPALDIAGLDAPLVAAFPGHLEADRHNTVRTRNWRLAAIHSLFGYPALHHPERAAVIQRVPAIPAKRHERTLLTRLTAPEADALLAAPGRGTRTGRRDHAMLVLAVQTGLRIAELTGLSHGDVVPGAGARARCMGKGRKERAAPLTGLTVAVQRAWLTENPGQAHDPLSPTRTGTRPSHDAIEHRLAVHLATARASCPSLRAKHATMHTLRHTCAMRLPVDTPEPTLPSSRPGSATSRWPPPTSTCTPTWSRRSQPSPGSPRPARRPAATSRPTRYPPSSTASDRSDLPPVDSPATHTNPRSGPNNHHVGSIGVL
jgi:integrase/recombinase XerD